MATVLLRSGAVVVLLALGLAACGRSTPFNYQNEADELKPGSGLFSGKKGEFVIFGRSSPDKAPASN